MRRVPLPAGIGIILSFATMEEAHSRQIARYTTFRAQLYHSGKPAVDLCGYGTSETIARNFSRYVLSNAAFRIALLTVSAPSHVDTALRYAAASLGHWFS
jgi:hypothetical protein